MIKYCKIVLPVGLLLFSAVSTLAQTAVNRCDLNADGVVNKADVDLATNMSVGTASCTASVIAPGVCNVAMVQRVINATTGACVTGTVRSATLTWTASTTAGIVGYRIYRSTVSGGPYTALNPSKPVAGTVFEDATVQAGRTYYYVVTTIDGNGVESPRSNQATAIVPSL